MGEARHDVKDQTIENDSKLLKPLNPLKLLKPLKPTLNLKP